MATSQTTKSCAYIPAIIGSFLFAGATALLIEDGWAHGLTVQNCLMPVLTASTVASFVYVHHAQGIFMKLMFVLIALLGSTLTVYGTVGRQAENAEGKASVARANNDLHKIKKAELTKAQEERDKECKKFGPLCGKWQAQVATLTNGMKGLVVVSVNPKVDQAVDIIHLVTKAEKDWLRELINTVDPVLLGLFLELGSIVFFAAAFPVQRERIFDRLWAQYWQVRTLAPESVTKSYSREQALQDLIALKTAGSQKFLADRWTQSEETVSKWLTAWEIAGQAQRNRVGKNKAIIAIGRR